MKFKGPDCSYVEDLNKVDPEECDYYDEYLSFWIFFVWNFILINLIN